MKPSQAKLRIVQRGDVRVDADLAKQRRGGPRPMPRYAVRVCSTFIRLPRKAAQ
jgi:hypothetical protein